MLNKLLAIFKPKNNKIESEENIEDPNEYKETSSVLLEKKLIDDIVRVLKPFRESKKEIKNLTLYISESGQDATLDLLLADNSFEDKLKTKLENTGISEAINATWKYKREAPDPEARLTTISKGIYLEISNKKEKSEAKLKIFIVGEKGELAQENYEFNTDFEDKLNIGRGPSPTLNDGRTHVNHIVIKDLEQNPDNTGRHLNQYVSRDHAYLTHLKGEVALAVYFSGSRLNGSRTRIFRENEEPIEMDNPVIPKILKNGDQIELAKSVLLQIIFI